MDQQEFRSVCKRVLELCEQDEPVYKAAKKELLKLFDQIEPQKISDEFELACIIDLHRKLSKVKNRKASFMEQNIGKNVFENLTFSIRMLDEDIPEDVIEQLEETVGAEHRISIKLHAALLKYAKEIAASKADKTKRYKKRVTQAIQCLDKLQQYYEIEGVKEIFVSNMSDKDEDLQFFALQALEVYYGYAEEKMPEDEYEELEKIIESTQVRVIASSCCNLLICAGEIDRFGALLRMDDWKEKERKRLGIDE